ncbi:MAG: DUF512 domain-containing protein [Christensenellales bacterium]
MHDLASLAPHALTVALVPVGLTKYREHLYPLRAYTQAEAEQVIQQAEAFQKEMLARCTARGLFSLLTSFIRSQSIRCQTWTATRIFRSSKTASVCSAV